jgi:hypothetical protein
MLDKYESWLTTAVKSADASKQSPLDLKPMMVLLEDKQKDVKREFFYDRVPVGGKIRAFGSPDKPDGNPQKLPNDRALPLMLRMEPEQLVTVKADDYRRWWGVDWNFIEACGAKHGAWTPQAEARLRKFIDYGHKLGYLMSFYSVNGFTDAQNQGWEAEFNFGSTDAAKQRWGAALKLHADFIATDQYELLGAALRPAR